MKIILYEQHWQKAVWDLIVSIQQNEFGIDISAESQPDLLNITEYYQAKKGNFWLAIDGYVLAGTISLLDIGNNEGSLRKMFVHPSYGEKKERLKTSSMFYGSMP